MSYILGLEGAYNIRILASFQFCATAWLQLAYVHYMLSSHSHLMVSVTEFSQYVQCAKSGLPLLHECPRKDVNSGILTPCLALHLLHYTGSHHKVPDY